MVLVGAALALILEALPLQDTQGAGSASATLVKNFAHLAGLYGQNAKLVSLDTLGVTKEQLLKLRQGMSEVCVRPDLDHRPGRSVSEIGKLIGEKATSYIKGQRSLDIACNRDLEAFLKAQAVIDWLRTHLLYDQALAGFSKYPPGPERGNRFNPEIFLSESRPSSVCGGITIACVPLGKSLGVEVYKTEGVLMWNADRKSIQHSWLVVLLPSGAVSFADPTCAMLPLGEAKTYPSSIQNPHVLPVEDWEMGFFANSHYMMTTVSRTEPYKVTKFGRDPYLKIDQQTLGRFGSKEFDALRRQFDGGLKRSIIWTR